MKQASETVCTVQEYKDPLCCLFEIVFLNNNPLKAIGSNFYPEKLKKYYMDRTSKIYTTNLLIVQLISLVLVKTKFIGLAFEDL